MTQAETAVEKYFVQLATVGRTRFDPPRARKEYDEALKGVRFYRFEDGSVARFDPGGDVQPS